MDFQGLNVSVVPPKALGDVTLYLYLAWQFRQAGADVSFFSDSMYSAQEYFPWLCIEPLSRMDLQQVAGERDLVISYVEHLRVAAVGSERILACDNIAYVTAKKLPKNIALSTRGVNVGGRHFPSASAPLCHQSRAGLSMREWIDRYVERVFGIATVDSRPMVCSSLHKAPGNRVLIFPTSPHAHKNYSLGGFLRLAQRLRRRGWQVEFVCLPSEMEALQAVFEDFPVVSFGDMRGLMAHIAGVATVVSNDSGGGHLASMLGLRTFARARRHARFVWRPGFSGRGLVVAPRFRFKWLDGQYVWRPFVPVGRIVDALGVHGKGAAASQSEAG